VFHVGRNNVSIATRYGLDDSGNRIPAGAPIQTCLGAYSFSYTMGTWSLSRK